MKSIELPNLPACVENSATAVDDESKGPAEPIPYAALMKRLAAARTKLPQLYRRVMLRPFVAELTDMGASDFEDLLAEDPTRQGDAGFILDLAQGILQNAERSFEPEATRALQEVVADLYDGFLSAEDRSGVKPPDRGVVAPLVKWGSPKDGPYTWPADDTASVGCGAGVVSMPPSHARGGVLSWAAVGHETAGHDVLHADDGLLPEIKAAVLAAVNKAAPDAGLPAYWAERIDETASDVMGILNMGPAAAIGMIGYFRGWSKGRKLSVDGPGNDVHPADIVRGWLGAEVVKRLSFADAAAWAARIAAETDADLGTRTIRLAGKVVTREQAVRSAAAVAQAIATTPLSTLEGRTLLGIQDWRDRDERVVARIRPFLRGKTKARQYQRVEGHYAAHVVAAAVYEALRTEGADLTLVQDCMILVLGKMLRAEAAWGPAFFAHGGRPKRHLMHR